MQLVHIPIIYHLIFGSNLVMPSPEILRIVFIYISTTEKDTTIHNYYVVYRII